jgi:excisionase family DNA binding protein
VHGIRAYRSAEKTGEWLTMSEAAKLLGVSNHAVRRLIKDGILAAEQVVPGAPYQIRATDLRNESVITFLARKGCPCRANVENQLPMFTDT